jgi:hypothetical protein
MLKAVITIDCDFCRKPFETAAVCDDQELWSSFASDLASFACGEGWEIDEELTKFLCDECREVLDQYRTGCLPDEVA